MGEWVHITYGMQEEAIQQAHSQRPGEDQDKEKLSPEDVFGLDSEVFGKRTRRDWQALHEMSHTDEDLASIFQGDVELRDRTAGLNDWMMVPETQKAARIKGDNPAVSDPLDERVYPDNSKVYPVSDITFYLVPCHADDFILGEMAHLLRSWLVQICEHYAWQLDSLSVRPNYLRWVLGDFPHLLTQDMLQIVRQETSKRIFAKFPRLQGGIQLDYWSMGYLMDLENREFSTQALMAHLERGAFRIE